MDGTTDFAMDAGAVPTVLDADAARTSRFFSAVSTAMFNNMTTPAAAAVSDAAQAKNVRIDRRPNFLDRTKARSCPTHMT